MRKTIYNEVINKKIEMDRIKHPSFPDYARVVPKYSDKTANSLTKAILDTINYTQKCFAFRVNVSGIPIHDNNAITKFRPAPTKGISDIIACIRGKYYSFEIKVGRDIQSEVQKTFQQKVESSEGRYYIIRSYDEFFKIFNAIK